MGGKYGLKTPGFVVSSTSSSSNRPSGEFEDTSHDPCALPIPYRGRGGRGRGGSSFNGFQNGSRGNCRSGLGGSSFQARPVERSQTSATAFGGRAQGFPGASTRRQETDSTAAFTRQLEQMQNEDGGRFTDDDDEKMEQEVPMVKNAAEKEDYEWNSGFGKEAPGETKTYGGFESDEKQKGGPAFKTGMFSPSSAEHPFPPLLNPWSGAENVSTNSREYSDDGWGNTPPQSANTIVTSKNTSTATSAPSTTKPTVDSSQPASPPSNSFTSKSCAVTPSKIWCRPVKSAPGGFGTAICSSTASAASRRDTKPQNANSHRYLPPGSDQVPNPVASVPATPGVSKVPSRVLKKGPKGVVYKIDQELMTINESFTLASLSCTLPLEGEERVYILRKNQVYKVKTIYGRTPTTVTLFGASSRFVGLQETSHRDTLQSRCRVPLQLLYLYKASAIIGQSSPVPTHSQVSSSQFSDHCWGYTPPQSFDRFGWSEVKKGPGGILFKIDQVLSKGPTKKFSYCENVSCTLPLNGEQRVHILRKNQVYKVKIVNATAPTTMTIFTANARFVGIQETSTMQKYLVPYQLLFLYEVNGSDVQSRFGLPRWPAAQPSRSTNTSAAVKPAFAAPLESSSGPSGGLPKPASTTTTAELPTMSTPLSMPELPSETNPATTVTVSSREYSDDGWGETQSAKPAFAPKKVSGTLPSAPFPSKLLDVIPLRSSVNKVFPQPDANQIPLTVPPKIEDLPEKQNPIDITREYSNDGWGDTPLQSSTIAAPKADINHLVIAVLNNETIRDAMKKAEPELYDSIIRCILNRSRDPEEGMQNGGMGDMEKARGVVGSATPFSSNQRPFGQFETSENLSAPPIQYPFRGRGDRGRGGNSWVGSRGNRRGGFGGSSFGPRSAERKQSPAAFSGGLAQGFPGLRTRQQSDSTAAFTKQMEKQQDEAGYYTTDEDGEMGEEMPTAKKGFGGFKKEVRDEIKKYGGIDAEEKEKQKVNKEFCQHAAKHQFLPVVSPKIEDLPEKQNPVEVNSREYSDDGWGSTPPPSISSVTAPKENSSTSKFGAFVSSPSSAAVHRPTPLPMSTPTVPSAAVRARPAVAQANFCPEEQSLFNRLPDIHDQILVIVKNERLREIMKRTVPALYDTIVRYVLENTIAALNIK